jgi:hypothetical protein
LHRNQLSTQLPRGHYLLALRRTGESAVAAAPTAQICAHRPLSSAATLRAEE